MSKEVMKQALDALELGCTDKDGNVVDLVWPAITALRQAIEQGEKPPKLAIEQFNKITKDVPPDEPIERLRFFCSLAMNGQDWLDVEQFFDAVIEQGEKQEHKP